MVGSRRTAVESCIALGQRPTLESAYPAPCSAMPQTIFNFFGLRENPFKINPDPRFLFVTDQVRATGVDCRRGSGPGLHGSRGNQASPQFRNTAREASADRPRRAAGAGN